WRELSRREACAVKRRPEAIAGSREVMADLRAVETGIDAAEENVEVGRDDVGDQKLTARPPMYFFVEPSGSFTSNRNGEFCACANSRPRSSLRSIGSRSDCDIRR